MHRNIFGDVKNFFKFSRFVIFCAVLVCDTNCHGAQRSAVPTPCRRAPFSPRLHGQGRTRPPRVETAAHAAHAHVKTTSESGTQGRGSREFLLLLITRTHARYICYLPVNSTSDRLRSDLAAIREQHDETDRRILQLIADTAELDARVSAMLAEDRPQ